MVEPLRVFFVVLRQPRSKEDLRSDPFWEYRSFGRTGCHGRNLLNPKTAAKRLDGLNRRGHPPAKTPLPSQRRSVRQKKA